MTSFILLGTSETKQGRASLSLRPVIAFLGFFLFPKNNYTMEKIRDKRSSLYVER